MSQVPFMALIIPSAQVFEVESVYHSLGEVTLKISADIEQPLRAGDRVMLVVLPKETDK